MGVGGGFGSDTRTSGPPVMIERREGGRGRLKESAPRGGGRGPSYSRRTVGTVHALAEGGRRWRMAPRTICSSRSCPSGPAALGDLGPARPQLCVHLEDGLILLRRQALFQRRVQVVAPPFTALLPGAAGQQ